MDGSKDSHDSKGQEENQDHKNDSNEQFETSIISSSQGFQAAEASNSSELVEGKKPREFLLNQFDPLKNITISGKQQVAKQKIKQLEDKLALSDQENKRNKNIIDGYKFNEDTLRKTLAQLEENLLKSEQKYESLKAHAKALIEKSQEQINKDRAALAALCDEETDRV